MASTVQLGKYQLIERIAYGGMAEVFKAKALGEAGFERTVAIKKLHSRYAEDREVVAMLQDEARLVSQLVHPNICQVFDLSRDGDSFFITMEYIDGRDLATVMRKAHKHFPRALPYPAIVFVMEGLLDALDYAHKKRDAQGRPLGIIHRDISPQNVIISYEGDIKVIDFGIAKARTQSHRTEQGVIKGKFRYMSPEQARGEQVDHRSDIFAAGVVFYELVLGRPHSHGLTDMQLLFNIQQGYIEPLDQIVPDVPATMNAIIERALAPDPEQRWATAGEFRRQLEAYARSSGLHFGRQAMAELMQDLFPGSWQSSTRVDVASASIGMVGSSSGQVGGTVELSPSDLLDLGPGSTQGQGDEAMLEGATVGATPMKIQTAPRREAGSPVRRSLPRGPKQVDVSPGISEPVLPGSAGPYQDPSIPDPLAAPPMESPPAVDDRPAPGGPVRKKTAFGSRRVSGADEREFDRRPGGEPARNDGPGLVKKFFKGVVWVLQTAVVLALLGGIGYLGWTFLHADSSSKRVVSHSLSSQGPTGSRRRMHRLTLNLSSRPEGARLFVQGRDTGVTTPTRLTLKLPSPVTIRLHKEGFPEWEQEIEFDDGETVQLTADLRRGHRIRRSRGRRGRRGRRSAASRSVHRPRGPSARSIAGPRSARDKDGPGGLDATLPGVLVVDANKKAWVYINGTRMDTTRASFTLKPGHYRVKVKDGIFSSPERVVQVKPGQRIITHFDVP